MVTVHRVPVVDSRDEITGLAESWQEYIEVADDHAANLDHYEEAAGLRSESPYGVERVLERLVESYDELQLERGWIEKKLQESSIRGHASYPHLDFGAVQEFRQKYGAAAGKMKEERTEDFFYLVANEFIEEDGVEWRVETEEIEELDDLIEMLRICQRSGGKRLEIENPNLPDTSPGGAVIKPEIFDHLVNAYRKAGREATYEAVAPYERIVQDNHQTSAVEEIWGIDVDEDVLESIEARQPLQKLAD